MADMGNSHSCDECLEMLERYLVYFSEDMVKRATRGDRTVLLEFERHKWRCAGRNLKEELLRLDLQDVISTAEGGVLMEK